MSHGGSFTPSEKTEPEIERLEGWFRRRNHNFILVVTFQGRKLSFQKGLSRSSEMFDDLLV